MIIENLYKGLGDAIESTLSKRRHNDVIKSTIGMESADSILESIFDPSLVKSESASSQISFGVKNIVRNRFGKHGEMRRSFGCHPDFNAIKGTGDLKYGYTVTLFMDIIGSTKLGVVYEPEEVFRIKNDIIRCAIETIDAFDGHVHRIMGDAVMAFFRSERKKSDGLISDSGIDALNCAVFLIEMMEKVVSPKLSELGEDNKEKIGIRIGIDYGKEQEVIWGTYGYDGADEVTATSYHVDVAAKLQQKAPKNSILVGANFAELLGIDTGDNSNDTDDSDKKGILKIPTKIIKGIEEEIPIVKPDYITKEGKKKNYKQYLVLHKEYIKYTPLNIESEELKLSATIKSSESVSSDDHYEKCSRSVKKGTGISFKAKFESVPNRDLKFLFRVENTGKEARDVAGKGNHETYVDARYQEDGIYFARHWERTAYKGIHHMFVSVWSGNTRLTSEERFSVFITE
ncbi:adenylate/guanylate cyclase domain-containing protein [Pantoea sp. Acro-807]|uniref:adenylate/guanylate cyclase domain-containing protein n=1 Tax=Pantoea sp. Acro-807 TaxID=2608356 RepID=UPI001419BD5E|nr:adenylate/guanylate cyclase domain-containing protein [Pantoea sp. Acro-807]NIE70334.1 adenylate/guanylate cyclase domain-containing protein [Pantoea sp. Acro-807]